MSLKDLFFKSSGEEIRPVNVVTQPKEAKQAAVRQPEVLNLGAQATVYSGTKPVYASSDAVVTPLQDSNYTELLRGALEAAAPQGVDFFKFLKVLDNMAKQPIPEDQKYVAAFAGLAAADSTLTVDKLVSTSATYLTVLTDQQTTFDKEMQQADAGIQKSMKDAEDLDAENQQLSDKIQANNQEIARLHTEASQAKIQLQSQQTGFVAARQGLEQKIQTIVNNIKLWIHE